MGVNQHDYLLAVTGGLPENGGSCTGFFQCDSPYASDAGAEVLRERNIEKAKPR